MQQYQKIASLIQISTPKQKKPVFTPEQIAKLKTVSEMILSVIAVAGIVSLAVVAPNIFSALGNFSGQGKKYSKVQKDRQIAKSFYYLKRTGLIRIKPTASEILLSVTKLGRKRAEKINIDYIQIKKNKRWDGKWWQVAADIPTKSYRACADALRSKLKQLNFYPLQRTLWFYPFDPRIEIEFLANHFRIGNFVTVMEINRLDKQDESKLKDFFNEKKII